MRVSAILKNVRLSPQKMRLVADMIRGKSVAYAMDVLSFSPQKGAKIIKKLMESAIANAEYNEGADIDILTVVSVCVDKGMVLKRMRPRAKGRAGGITKPSSHIVLVVGY